MNGFRFLVRDCTWKTQLCYTMDLRGKVVFPGKWSQGWIMECSRHQSCRTWGSPTKKEGGPPNHKSVIGAGQESWRWAQAPNRRLTLMLGRGPPSNSTVTKYFKPTPTACI
jgi:hypothetical protein